METTAKNLDKTYTYGDYLTWPRDERWEIIKGIPYAMTPGAATEHQIVLGNLFGQFWNYLKNKSCKVFNSPYDVLFPIGMETDETEIKTVVQPDILVVCDLSKLEKTKCKGAPDLIVEILSASNAEYDMKVKRDLYEVNGVKEYWIVDVEHGTVSVYRLESGKYGKPEIYGREATIKVSIFPDLEIDIKEVFS